MSKENENYKLWSLEIGFYPGIVIRHKKLLRKRASYSRAIHATY